MNSKKWWEIYERRKACDEEVRALAQRAGIAAEVERAAEGPFTPSNAIDRPPRNSKEWHENEKSDDKYTEYRLRTAYFSAPDIGLRKQIIAKICESDEFTMQIYRLRVDEAATAVSDANKDLSRWPLWAGLLGIALVAAGYYFFGLVGAIGGAVFAFFTGRDLENKAKLRIRGAESELHDAQGPLNERLNDPSMFSRSERRTGQPDKGH